MKLRILVLALALAGCSNSTQGPNGTSTGTGALTISMEPVAGSCVPKTVAAGSQDLTEWKLTYDCTAPNGVHVAVTSDIYGTTPSANQKIQADAFNQAIGTIVSGLKPIPKP